jgi:integrase
MKEPKLWQRAQTGCWYVTLNGKQVPLGKDEAQARKKYHALLAEHNPPADGSAYRLLNRYLAWCKLHCAEGTFKLRRRHLRKFGLYLGRSRKVSELKPYHVQRFVDSRYTGRSTTYHNDAITIIKGALTWAVGQGYIDRNPIEKMKMPPRAVRQEFVKAVDWQRVLEAAKGDEFRDYLTLALSSGARPQELRIIEARHFDAAGKRLVFPILESKGKKRSRVIYLDDTAFEIVERLSKQWPEGPILRNSRGVPWNKGSINCRFRRLRATLGIPKLCATVLRHSFAHQKLVSGTDSLVVSKLLGHTDGRMVATRYGHLEEASDFLRKAANSSNPLRPADGDEDTPASRSA